MRRRVDARRENTISTSGRLFTRMREPCNGVNRVRQRPGSSVRNTPGTPPLMAIKLPENHARLSARCHIRSFPLTGSYEAVISERKRKSKIERGRRLSPPFPLYLLLPFLRFPADPSSPTDPFVLGCNPSAALAPAYRSGRLLSHDGNTVGDKVEVTSVVNSQKLFTKLLAGSGARRRYEWFAVARVRYSNVSRASCLLLSSEG